MAVPGVSSSGAPTASINPTPDNPTENPNRSNVSLLDGLM
jgi:hypothetical protein